MVELRYVTLRVITRCSDCGQPLTMDEPLARLECLVCGASNDLGEQTVAEILADSDDDEMFDGVRAAPPDKTVAERSSTVMTGGRTIEVTRWAWRQVPRCSKCEPAKVSLEVTTAQTPSGIAVRTRCPTCGDAHEYAPAPAPWAGRVRALRTVLAPSMEYGATKAVAAEKPRAAEPTIFPCPSCGAALPVDGSARTVACQYCHKNIFLPDELWRSLNPVRRAQPFGLAFDEHVERPRGVVDPPPSEPPPYGEPVRSEWAAVAQPVRAGGAPIALIAGLVTAVVAVGGGGAAFLALRGREPTTPAVSTAPMPHRLWRLETCRCIADTNGDGAPDTLTLATMDLAPETTSSPFGLAHATRWALEPTDGRLGKRDEVALEGGSLPANVPEIFRVQVYCAGDRMLIATGASVAAYPLAGGLALWTAPLPTPVVPLHAHDHVAGQTLDAECESTDVPAGSPARLELPTGASLALDPATGAVVPDAPKPTESAPREGGRRRR